ncbi:hypothetical protein [Gloeobacter kilaueensis]|uniref:Uncharacterized protein n=1 Tax=Gloeobacter kilaueensis (strain ATCC BAA-2537 / CCAP 1431/1 / ULC 316 / JS1) TaxID=1183438 RepID=U5QFD8_GLOK1|nr:hypothetical protein [Gloeobacter kilaueensis]AGY57656.1 hypothetical protein GKIL_1410 [Gloeobacter kilaueensis JS1]
MEPESFLPLEEQAPSPAAAPSAAQIIPRPLPTALGFAGVGLLLAFLADLLPFVPPQTHNLLWQIAFLEHVFNTASVAMLGILLLLAGIWLGDILNDEKSRLKSSLSGSLALLVGLALVFSVPLYIQNVNRLYQIKKSEILSQRKSNAPLVGGSLADRFDTVLVELDNSIFKNTARYSANALAIGFVTASLGIFAIRYTRNRPEVGYTCPACDSSEVRRSGQLSPTEQSLALFTRIHTFRCNACGWRFRRFSLTGKPFPFFF